LGKIIKTEINPKQKLRTLKFNKPKFLVKFMKKGKREKRFGFFNKNQKGSHVGVLLSFMIFVTFLMFIFSAINPLIKMPFSKQSALDNLKINFINFSSEELVTFTIHLEGILEGKDCVKIQGVVDDIKEITDINNLITTDGMNNPLNYSVSGEGLIVQTGYDYNGLLKIYLADRFEPSMGDVSGGCHPLTGYSIESLGTMDYHSEDYLGGIIKRYEDEYEALKLDLNIPANTEFGFSFTYSDGTILEVGEISTTESVYAEEFYVQYMDEGGNLNMGMLKVYLW